MWPSSARLRQDIFWESPVHAGFVKFLIGAMDPVPNAKPAVAGVKPVLNDEN